MGAQLTPEEGAEAVGIKYKQKTNTEGNPMSHPKL